MKGEKRELTDKQKEVFEYIKTDGPLLAISAIARKFNITQNAAKMRIQAIFIKGWIRQPVIDQKTNCMKFEIKE